MIKITLHLITGLTATQLIYMMLVISYVPTDSLTNLIRIEQRNRGDYNSSG